MSSLIREKIIGFAHVRSKVRCVSICGEALVAKISDITHVALPSAGEQRLLA